MKKIDTIAYKQIRNNGSTLIVPRPQMKKEIDFLDQHPDLIRRNINAMVWLNLDEAKLPIKNRYKNKPAIIIGKGPSLDNIVPQMIPEDCVVLLCNEAYFNLDVPNQKYAVQVDRVLGNIFNDPKINRIIGPNVIDFYSAYDTTTIFTNILLKDSRICPVGKLACLASKYWGCSPIILTGFDGAFGGSLEYADKIGYPSSRGGYINRFRLHKDRILTALKDTIYEHVPITSVGQTTIISDSIQRLQDNPQSPCALKDSRHLVDYTDKSDSVLDKDTAPLESQPDHSDSGLLWPYHECDNQTDIRKSEAQAKI